MPSRRSTIATIARVSPRSRSSSAASAAVAARASEPSSISSSARCRSSTPSTISAATRRTARPGESSRSPERGFFLRAFFAKDSSLRSAHGYAKSGAMPTEPQNPRRTRGPSERKAPAAAGRRTRACRSRSAPRRARPQRRSGKGIRGRGGLDPTRYGDWEKDGLTSDFLGRNRYSRSCVPSRRISLDDSRSFPSCRRLVSRRIPLSRQGCRMMSGAKLGALMRGARVRVGARWPRIAGGVRGSLIRRCGSARLQDVWLVAAQSRSGPRQVERHTPKELAAQAYNILRS